jgi:ubiquinone/menaquinone biosynthesis C-methylase UbiE/uncharacterized protein YbaR (Trm112 family)
LLNSTVLTYLRISEKGDVEVHKMLVPLLACPVCHGELRQRIVREDTSHIIEGEFTCVKCGRKYPVIDQIGVFIESGAAVDDLWKKQEDFAVRFRREHPFRYFLLTRTFFGNVKPQNYFLKGLLLEDEGILERAMKRVYTRDYLVGYELTKEALRKVEAENPSVILEVACGRGGFFKQFLRSRRGSGVYVASDFSLSVLRSDLRWLQANGLDGQVTLLAFDAKAMPFRDGSVPAVVSNVGFINIQNGEQAVGEAFRVLVSRGVLVANFMFTTEQTANYLKAKELGFDQFYIRKSTEEVFRRVGFVFDLREVYRGHVRPTPSGIDGLPVVPDVYAFCVLKAKKQ